VVVAPPKLIEHAGSTKLTKRLAHFERQVRE